ncbi:MAG: hypothetical protein KME64_16340 [Scytonematopsis contorta HA4267-MV1]|jgi:hypothetical protein|nr:hypothetical protein [Scytonematopsis contorta HA4267-MV1]
MQNYTDMLTSGAFDVVFQEIERQTNVDRNTLKVIRAEYRVWSNGCLDLQGLGDVCSAVLTPGWIVEVEGKNQRWVYHTDQTRTYVKEAGFWSESSGNSTLARE